jgi:cytochrome P450
VADLDFDPFDPAWFADPYPAYRQMRAEHPVYERQVPDHRVWSRYFMLSRAQDVGDALADWRTFSSAQGTLIDTDITLLPPNMFNMDPPRHDEHRSTLARVLTPSRVAALEPHVRGYALEIVRELGPKGAFDASTDLAQLIPTITMCTLMDLPRSGREKFLQWNLDTLGGGDFTSPAALQAYGEMAEYWQGIVAERKASPGTDLISQILHAPVQGDELTDEEVSGFCSLLHDASQNTTMNMITNAIVSLGRFPDQRRWLADHPERWGPALEELLRYESPVQGLARTTTRDVTLHDVTIPEGEQVLLLYGSANHDETVFDAPDELDLQREIKVHWTFGHGIHYCLGNAVARLETRVTVQVLLETIRDWEVDLDGVERNQLVPTRGVAHAPVAFTPVTV